MGLLWKHLEEKLQKAKREYKECPDELPYRFAELFCIKCGKSLGRHDICCTDLDGVKYCDECAKEYIKETPYNIPVGKILSDSGTDILIEYKNSYYDTLRIYKQCYFGKKGRYIKVKNKRYYI